MVAGKSDIPTPKDLAHRFRRGENETMRLVRPIAETQRGQKPQPLAPA